MLVCNPICVCSRNNTHGDCQRSVLSECRAKQLQIDVHHSTPAPIPAPGSTLNESLGSEASGRIPSAGFPEARSRAGRSSKHLVLVLTVPALCAARPSRFSSWFYEHALDARSPTGGFFEQGNCPGKFVGRGRRACRVDPSVSDAVGGPAVQIMLIDNEHPSLSEPLPMDLNAKFAASPLHATPHQQQPATIVTRRPRPESTRRPPDSLKLKNGRR